MCWSWMKFGLLCSGRASKSGYGWLCVGGLGKLWLGCLVPEPKELAASCGTRSPNHTRRARVSLTFGSLTLRYCQQISIAPALNSRGRPITSKDSISLCVSVSAVWSESHSPFPRSFCLISGPFDSFSSSTIRGKPNSTNGILHNILINTS